MKEGERSTRAATLHRNALELRAEYVGCDDNHERQTIRNDLDAVECQIAQAEWQVENQARLPDFWDDIYGSGTGFLVLFSGRRGSRRLEWPQERYFPYPHATTAAVLWVQDQVEQEREVYQCAHLVTDRLRRKETAAPIASLWVDLDHDRIDPAVVPPPSVQVQSSPGRLQAYWRLKAPIVTATAEHFNRQLAYRLQADKSGWDATQLLRVPGTINHKYPDKPVVDILSQAGRIYDLDDLGDPLADLPIVQPVESPPAQPPRRGLPLINLPALPLTAAAQRIVSGEQVRRRPDGEIDRSAALLQIARVLAGVGLEPCHIAQVLAERDEALGWRKYSDRDDAQRQYWQIANLVVQ